MSTGAWISLLGIAASALVALAVAYMHRKQMRQIELHRADPNAPLVPPPHPVTVYFKKWWPLPAGLVFNVSMLIWTLRQSTPLTRLTVAEICGWVGNVFLSVVLMVAVAIWDHFVKTLSNTLELLWTALMRRDEDLTQMLNQLLTARKEKVSKKLK